MIYNENDFKSSLKTYIANYLNEKEILKQHTKLLYFHLRTFDDMCFNLQFDDNKLTKEIVLKWLEKRPNECLNNQAKRASIIRCFGYYIFRYNTQSYILPKMIYPAKEKYIPHIYTHDEIKRFFYVVDNIEAKSNIDTKPITMPIIYRLLLFTGMRINEILSLKISDLKIEIKSLLIRNAKNNKDRLIPLSDELFDKIHKYNQMINKNRNTDNYLFRNLHGNKISEDSFYEYFRMYLFIAKIPHTGKGPRVHDFRHTFIINAIHKCLIEEKDIKVFLPYLQTYLGHSSVEATYYYYHMTIGIYPYLEQKINKFNNDIIPRLEELINE